MSKVNETGPPTTKLSVLVFRDDGIWIAQVLEYDIAAQAHTLKDVKYELEKLLVGHIAASLENGLVPFVNTPAAPPELWDMFNNAEDWLAPRDDWPEFRLPPA